MKYLVNIELTVEVEAEDAGEAKTKFLREIEEETQQTFYSWIYDQLTVVGVK